MRRTRSVMLALVLLIAAACSGTKPPTATAVQGNKVITTLQDLSFFYGKKNAAGFMGQIAGSFKDRSALAESVQSVFARYDTVQFTVQYSKMFITIDDKGIPRATFNWESGWDAAGGNILKNSGRAIFVFEPKEGKLAGIEGKNPFLPQAIETQKP